VVGDGQRVQSDGSRLFEEEFDRVAAVV